jgi:hypothetical protein
VEQHKLQKSVTFSADFGNLQARKHFVLKRRCFEQSKNYGDTPLMEDVRNG